MSNIELTAEEKKNGWTEESLEKYFKDREKAQAAVVLSDKQQRSRYANNKYSPLQWR